MEIQKIIDVYGGDMLLYKKKQDLHGDPKNDILISLFIKLKK